MAAYKVIREKDYRLCCFACYQIAHQEEVSVLQNEVSWLSALVSDLQSKSTSTIPETEPTPSRSYSSAVITGECGDTLHRQPFPSKESSYESPRKFNVVVFGIEECSQGAKRHERLASDPSKINSVLVHIDGSLKSCSIKDYYHLGRYKVDQVKPRPILVKFVRIEDVSKVFANRWVAKSPILVKPDMSKEERVRESVLLKQRWSLICSGVPKRAIKVSRSKIFVNNVEYGTYSHAGFVHSTDYPVRSAPAPAKEIPSNHGPQTSSKTTASTTPPPPLCLL